MLRSPRLSGELSLVHGVQKSSARSSVVPWVAAFLLFASAAAADPASFVLQYDAISAAGGFLGGTQLGMTAGQPVTGFATGAGGSIRETVGFWHPLYNQLVSVDEPGAQSGLAFAFMPIAPNPTVRNARIRYVIPGATGAGASQDASVRVFDIAGRLVRVLASGPHTPGEHTVVWDGLNSAGARLSAGVFLVEVSAGPHRSVQRVIMLR